MSFEYSPYILPLIAAALVSAVVAVYSWMRRSANGAYVVFLTALAIFVWTVGYSLEIAGRDLDTKYFWGVIQYIGIAFAPYGWLVFSIVYGRQVGTSSRRYMIAAAFIPFVTVLLALTTKWHGLIWSEYHITRLGDFSAISPSYGPWFWVHLAYSYVALLAGTVLLVRVLLRRQQGMYRGQIFALLIAVLAPWLGNALYITGNSPIPHLDLTPFAFTITIASVAWAILGFHLVDIAPLARDIVMDAMREGMIVLDVRGNIVDINNAAARMIGVPAANAIGKTAEDVFHPWSHLVERFRNVMEAKDEIAVGMGEAKRSYEVRLSPLRDQQGQLAGRIIMLRAMDDDAPPPRFARGGASQSDTRPYDRAEMEELERPPLMRKNRFVQMLVDFYYPLIKTDLDVPGNFNPVWYRTRERMFTLVTRLMATLMTLAVLFFAASDFRSVGGGLALLACAATLFVMGAIRDSAYYFRVIVFFTLIYALGFLAALNFGLSVPSIVFFMFYVVASAALTSPRGAFYAFLTGILTFGVFAILIGVGTFIPFKSELVSEVFPFSLLSGLGAVFIFASSTFIILTSTVLLLNNLDRAWQKETQTLNLLQQERDLLEQRVEERTHALAEARDKAEKVSNELRKYFRAIEQSGSTVVITDVDGNIEYANPRFAQSTGYSLAEAAGKNPRILKSGNQSHEYYRQMWKTISAGQVWNGEFLNKRKDGSLYWEYATIAPVMDQGGVITNYVAIKEDVTERKSAEEQLLRLSQAVEQSGNTVLVMDRNGLIEYVNPKFTEVTGYSSAEALGKSPIALMNGFGAASDFSQDDWWLTVTSGQIWHGEFHNHRKDGIMFWESATIAPVHDRDGRIINFVEIKQDITEQKILQEQLQKQNDYLSILHQVTLDLLNRRDLNDLLQVIVDRSAVLLDAPFSELMLAEDGFLIVASFTANQPELKGDCVTREQARLSWLAHETHQPVILEDYSAWEYKRDIYDDHSLRATADFPVMAGDRCLGVLALGRSQPDYAFTTEQVETGILFARLVALVLDNANLYDSAMKEIAERKYAEALLQESEERFRQIVENASDIIYRADTNGNFTYVNPSALKMMGYAGEEEVLGRHYLELTTPEFRNRLKRFYDHQYLGKTQSTYYEFPAVTVDGQMVWVGQNVQLIMDGEQVAGFQAVARDITQLKQAQEALSLSRDQALDASRFKSQLLSRVSHELRTPLGGILGYAELLQFKAFGSLNENQQNAVRNIIESTNYLTNVVNDLLDQAQIESNSISLYSEYFNPAALLEKTKTTISVLTKKKDLSLVTEIAPDLPGELYGDVNRLQQILFNLAGNAVKFTKAGQISIRFKRPTPAQWTIEVQDTGTGVPAEDQRNIFEPFHQVNNSITRGNRGSGLGLAITKQLVELMGGQISLESQVGKGSLFTVTLPIINAPGE
jgi:PAS domain S-box-containing protein